MSVILPGQASMECIVVLITRKQQQQWSELNGGSHCSQATRIHFPFDTVFFPPFFPPEPNLMCFLLKLNKSLFFGTVAHCPERAVRGKLGMSTMAAKGSMCIRKSLACWLAMPRGTFILWIRHKGYDKTFT